MFALFPGGYDGLLTWPFPKNDSSFSPRSTRPPDYVDYHLRTLREGIFSMAYQRTSTYPNELQLLSEQQYVQQN